MDMRSVLQAGFAVPTTAPEWQSELLLRLGGSEADQCADGWIDEPQPDHLQHSPFFRPVRRT